MYANRNAKTAGVAIVISEKIDFRTKAIRTEKDAFISHNESGINKRKPSNCKRKDKIRRKE